MQEKILIAGMAFLLVGIFLLVIGSFIGTSGSSNKSKVETAFGGFIGPIPFGFFSSWNALWVWAIFLMFLFLFWVIARRFF